MLQKSNANNEKDEKVEANLLNKFKPELCHMK